MKIKKLDWTYDAALNQYVASPFPGVRYVAREGEWKMDNNETVNYVNPAGQENFADTMDAAQKNWDEFIERQILDSVAEPVVHEPLEETQGPGIYFNNVTINLTS